MARLRVGCAMWANRDWIGRALPEGTPSGQELEAYARIFDAVEGNTTFYALPTPATTARWAAATPPDFRFLFKLPRTVTHDRRLRNIDDETNEFLRVLEPLGERAESISIQLPASFGPDSLADLDRFLASATTEHRWAVEVRHAAFFGPPHERALNDLLHARGADRVVLDSRPLFAGPCTTPAEHDAFRSKPRLPVRAVATADRPVVRFIGQGDLESNPPFWEPWVTTVARWLADGRHPTVFLHTPDNVHAPALARRFHVAVAGRVPDLEPLPEVPTRHQDALFD